MPLLDIEKQLFVCKNEQGTIQITVKNTGTNPLELSDVFPIGECRDYIHIHFNNEAINRNDTTDIEVKIDDYWKPAEIQFNTNCPRTGKIIYVLRPEDLQGPNLWLFPDEKYNRDQVFFHGPEPYLQLPIIVQSNSDNPLEIDFCPIKLGDRNTNGNSVVPCKIAVYCGKTGREINHQGNERRYQIVNTQDDYQVHSACIYFSQDVFQNGSVVQEIQLKICTNSHLKALREQKISIQLTKFEVPPIVKRSFWLRLRKKKRVEVKIKNSGPHPLRIFSIATDLDKIQVKYFKADNKKDEVSYPIVIEKNESKKFDITIKSSFKEWLWSGTDLSKISVSIYAKTIPDSEDSCVLADEEKIERVPIFEIAEGTFVIERVPIFEIAEGTFVLIFIITVFMHSLFFLHPKREVIVSSYPHGQTVRVDGEEAGTTPTLLKVKGNAGIRIGISNEMQVNDVEKEGTIFFPGSEWETGKGESK